MEQKTSIVTECNYDKPWEAPNKDVIHYHSLTMENGDIGNVGVSEKFAPKIGVGAKVTYTINGNKIKFISSNMENAPAPAPGPGSNNLKPNTAFENTPAPPQKQQTWGKGSPKKIEDNIGYVFGYAKDLTVGLISQGNAKAKKDPAKTTIDIAETIYKKMNEMLSPGWCERQSDHEQ
jgi:hypothetical protein